MLYGVGDSSSTRSHCGALFSARFGFVFPIFLGGGRGKGKSYGGNEIKARRKRREEKRREEKREGHGCVVLGSFLLLLRGEA